MVEPLTNKYCCGPLRQTNTAGPSCQMPCWQHHSAAYCDVSTVHACTIADACVSLCETPFLSPDTDLPQVVLNNMCPCLALPEESQLVSIFVEQALVTSQVLYCSFSSKAEHRPCNTRSSCTVTCALDRTAFTWPAVLRFLPWLPVPPTLSSAPRPATLLSSAHL